MNTLERAVSQAWAKITPAWPINQMVAQNPLEGWMNESFDEAFPQILSLFDTRHYPSALHALNRETIKWMHLFTDKGQSYIPMPNKKQGLFASVKSLLQWDTDILDKSKRLLLKKLNNDERELLHYFLNALKLPDTQWEMFFTSLLTTLPGWAAYAKYLSEVEQKIASSEYLALRVMLFYLMGVDVKAWVDAVHQPVASLSDDKLSMIESFEATFSQQVMTQFPYPHVSQHPTDIQCVFCIDVRSEPMRRVAETAGIETFGYAGFFGLPIALKDHVHGESLTACPVLIEPEHEVAPVSKRQARKIKRYQAFKNIYQSTKYAFTAPFALVEMLGLATGAWMFMKTAFPRASSSLKRNVKRKVYASEDYSPSLKHIPLESLAQYAANTLKQMGLTKDFASKIVICGHTSQTENNAYAATLNCGACAGQDGSLNAKLIVDILNDKAIRDCLIDHGIIIPGTTQFFAAVHNTTLNTLDLLPGYADEPLAAQFSHLSAKLTSAAQRQQANDWACVRPEWGLSRNAGMIIAPRHKTRGMDFDGRVFLHSYEPDADQDGAILAGILKGPLRVALGINMQYLCATLDNRRLGGGSKVTQNIVGKIGVIQGNGSDLMHGLPWQSVYENHDTAYHQPCRLHVWVDAPRERIEQLLLSDETLGRWVKGGWLMIQTIETPILAARQASRSVRA